MADDAADPGGAQDVAPAGPVDGAVTPPPAVDPFAPAEGSHVRLALVAGLVAVLVMVGVTCWLGFGALASQRADEQRAEFLRVGRQGAVDLTTIDYTRVDDDVQRILDSATGPFLADFQQRAVSFADVVKRVRSKAVGRVTEAGIDEYSPIGATVLVAVTVDTTIEGQPPQPRRAWRMRIAVERDPEGAVKVSNVEFVA